MAKDVVTFLHWAAEPEHDERKKIGLKAVILFSALTAISLYVKRAKWAGIKSRKIRACNSNGRFPSSPADFFDQCTLLRLANTISLFVLGIHYFVVNIDHYSSTLPDPRGYRLPTTVSRSPHSRGCEFANTRADCSQYRETRTSHPL